MKSKYVPNLPASAKVTTIPSVNPFEPREVIVCQNPPPGLFACIDKATELARSYGIQRPAADWRVQHYEKEIEKGELKSIIISLVQFKDGKLKLLATEDGAHKNKAAANKGFKGLVVIEVYQVDTLENARILASKFDSRVSSRSYANTILYVYGANPEYSLEHIKYFTSSMLHLLAGTPGNDETKVGESSVEFKGKFKVHDFWNVYRVKTAFEPILKWFDAEFSIGRDDRSKLFNVGVVTAMLQSYIVYGPDVKSFWKQYFVGNDLKEGSPLMRLRDRILSGRGGGAPLLLDNYRLAVWAFLSETGRHGMTGTSFYVGRPYHMMFGYAPGYKPSKSKKAKKEIASAEVSVSVTATAKAA